MWNTIRITILCCWLLPCAAARSQGAVYDFSTGAGVDRFAYGDAIPQTPLPPATNAIPSTVFGSADYTAVGSSDDSRYSTGVIEGGDVAAMRFVFSIAEPPATVAQIDIHWEGGADQDGMQSVWLWNAATGSYELVGSRTGATPPDGVVFGTFATGAPDFVDAAGAVTVLVNYGVTGGALLTDYVSVTITGGAPCNDDLDCDDGLFCNGAETCDPVAGCEVATPVDCDDGIPSTFDLCDETVDACVHVPIDYTIVPVPLLGGPMNTAYGINDSGHVVGSSAVNLEPWGDWHAYAWDGVALTDLGTLGGSYSVGFDINNAAQVTGYSEIANEVQRPFLWENGAMTELGGVPSAFSSGWGINEFAQVAGHYGNAAFFWENGAMTDLGSLCGSPVRAHGINEAGQIAGKSSVCGTFWEDDGDPKTIDLHILGTLPGGLMRTRGRGINDVGQVVGDANFGSADLEDYHAVLWENLAWDADGDYIGDITDLGTLPGGQRSFAYAINNTGRVVGYAASAGIGASHATVWDGYHGLRDLNDLIPPGSGWLLSWADDINEFGQIVGTGTFNGETRGYLLTPVAVCGDGICESDEPLTCPQDCPTIPTVSQWGMVVMTCLVLIAGAIVLQRRRGEARVHVR